jgi:hypothetical protein
MSNCICAGSSLFTSVKGSQVIGRRISFCRIELLLHLSPTSDILYLSVVLISERYLFLKAALE